MFGGTGIVNKDKVSKWMGGHSGGYGRGSRAAGSSRSCYLLVWLHFDDSGQQFPGCIISSSSSSLEMIFVLRVCVASDHVMCVLAQLTVVTRARGF